MQKEKHSSSWLGNSVRWFVVHDHVNIHILRSLLWDLCNNYQAQMSFICHIHNYTEYNQQWNVLSAFNPSKCAHTWSSGQPTLRRPGSSWGYGALLKSLTSVVDNSCRSRDSKPTTSGYKSDALSIRATTAPPHTHIHTSVWKCLVRIE